MTLEEAYEKWKHMDRLMSDTDWIPRNAKGAEIAERIIYDLWQAVKEEAEKNKGGD